MCAEDEAAPSFVNPPPVFNPPPVVNPPVVNPPPVVIPVVIVTPPSPTAPAAFGGSLSIRTSIPILADIPNGGLLSPYVSGSHTRWASSHGAATCVYVINLTAEPSFLSGLVYSTAPVWGIFRYTSADQMYRGLAFSRLSVAAPPTTTTSVNPWASSWRLSTGAVVERPLIPQVLSVTDGGQTQVTQLAYGAFPVQASNAAASALSLWTMPIRLPDFIVDGSVASLASYGTNHAVEGPGTQTEEPDKTLKAETNAEKYVPRLIGSTLRWVFPSGGDSRYPDLYLQLWAPQTAVDSPEIAALVAQVPAGTRWIVYGDYASVPRYKLMAYTSSSDESDMPPTGGNWRASETRAIRFSLTPSNAMQLPAIPA